MSHAGHDISTWPARLGVKPGDTIQLMADLTRVAWNARRAGKRFSADGFLDAFADAVGPTGTVLVPTYNFDLRAGDVFDIRSTRSISGALANAALDHPRFRRTPHPLHSFAVTGAGSDALIRSEERSSFGPGSPFAYLMDRRATLIAIDLPLNDAVTFAHFTEEATGVSYRRHRPIRLGYTSADGNTGDRIFSLYAKKPGHHMDFTRLEQMAEHDGAITRIDLDGSKALRLGLPWVHAMVEHDIRTNKARTIHQFRWSWWLKDHMKELLRTFGIRTRQERTAHAARTA